MNKMMLSSLLAFLIALTCTRPGHSAESAPAPGDATQATQKANAAILQQLPFGDREDFEAAQRGLIAKVPATVAGRRPGVPLAWDLASFAFIAPDAQAPATVNPSLWRLAQLNMHSGLFKVTDRVYQVRGLDLSNVSFIEGATGWIVVDPLITVEVARAALDLIREHVSKKPVVAVIYTHSHADHYGGVTGIVSEQDVKEGRVKIIAPKDFMVQVVSENVSAGPAMGRRATYMFGPFLPKGPRGQVDAGLGKTISTGVGSLLAPTDIIDRTGQTMTVDGVDFVFQYTPDTEAPAEMNFYLPQFRALCMAENVSHNMHNLYTPRGALVRDAKAWAHYLDEAIDLFAGKTDVLFISHHWPTWGQDKVLDLLKGQRDLYKYLHDQTLRLANHGYTGTEIAEVLTLPDSLGKKWYNRSYYGTLSHNVKAIYQRYLGWFDGNPANLNSLPPVEASVRYVEFMGGARAVLAKARESFNKGEYRWVAQVVNHVVYADPGNEDARYLQADALEQLGYQAESAVWRNFYLMGALELRRGVPKLPSRPIASPDVIAGMSTEMVLDTFAVRLNGPRAAGKVLRISYIFPDTSERFLVWIENSVLHYRTGAEGTPTDATLTLTRPVLNQIVGGAVTFDQKISAGEVKIEGRREALEEFLSLMDTSTSWFNIVTPRPQHPLPRSP